MKTGKPVLYIILLITIAAVSLDLATSLKYAVEQGTFRYESEFDAITAATVKVAIVPSDYPDLENPVERDVNPTYAQIEDMVRKAIELQGGLEWVVQPGDLVMLKVNLVGGNSPSGQGVNTDVRVVKALIKIIDEHTEGNVEMVVAEGTARINDTVDAPESVWDNSGYQDLLVDSYLSGINFSLFNLNQTYEDLVEVNLGSKATAAPHGGKYHVHRKELEADVFISVPVLKIHDTGITNALKNQIGTAPGAYYGYNKMKGSEYYGGLKHDVNQRRWTTEEIVDFSTIADIDFVVVDAIMCLEKYKDYQGDNQVRFNTIVAGADPVAVDHICTRLLGLNPDDIAHITLAEKIGLGTNNPESIEIVGSAIDDVHKKVVKNNKSNGKFGQSNRTWLLSEPFSSTDISTEFIQGEDTLHPEAGSDGWSEPVFFFDDRIDLLSFYQGAEDIVSYSFTYFSSPSEQDAELWIGTQEDMVIYLNGSEAYTFSGVNVFGDGDLFTKIADVHINEGVNTLMVKTLHQFGDYSFCLNICEVEDNPDWMGNRVEGLKFFTSLSDTGSHNEPDVLRIAESENIQTTVWPNPASEFITVRVDLEYPSKVEIAIIDMSGRLVADIAHRKVSSGSHQFYWDMKRNNGAKTQPGNYLCLIKTVSGLTVHRIIVVD